MEGVIDRPYHSDAIFLKKPLTTKLAMKVMEFRDGERPDDR